MKMLKQNNSNIVTVIDIGSTKIVCIIAKLLHSGESIILGIGHQAAEGIRHSVITDIDKAGKAIVGAIEGAEKMSGIKPLKVYITVSSHNLLSQHIITDVSITGRDITYRDLNKLLIDAIQKCRNQQLEIIHTFACDYILDGHRGIMNPVGMYGNKLSCEFNILSATTNNLLNINTCISKSGVEVESYIASIYATAMACLMKEEVNTGVTLIDFGAGGTSFAAFENGQLIYNDSIPMGGIDITNDIAKILCITYAEAERIKNLYGGVIASEIDKNEIINVEYDDEGEDGEIARADLIAIIQARIEEIVNLIEEKLLEANVSQIHKLVVTGGVAKTLCLKEFLMKKFNTKVRIGYPQKLTVKSEQNIVMEFSTAIGAIIHIAETVKVPDSNNGDDITKQTSVTYKILSWIKKQFFE